MFIREASLDDADVVVNIIRDAFKEVAERMGFTEESNPRATPFYTRSRFMEDVEKDNVFYLLQLDGQPCGCVAIEKANDKEVRYLRRLAVLPECRKQGFGKALVDHVFKEAARQGASRIEIGIIAEDEILRNWYAKLVFASKGTKKFDHLPFMVEFMKKEL